MCDLQRENLSTLLHDVAESQFEIRHGNIDTVHCIIGVVGKRFDDVEMVELH